MSVLKSNFSPDVNQYSPVLDDVQRVVSHDEDGVEFISYLPIDYSKIQKSLGSVNDWKLEVLLQAGINPDFPIHTGYNTRLEGLNSLEDFAAMADTIIAEENNKE